MTKIEAITAREIRMRLKTPFETSFAVTQDRRIILIEVSSEGSRGWGEITAGETPGFSAETTDTAWQIISDFIAPMLVGKPAAASDVPALLANIRGHEMVKAGVENALWDIESQRAGLPLWKHLGGTRTEIDCGVSLGIREN